MSYFYASTRNAVTKGWDRPTTRFRGRKKRRAADRRDDHLCRLAEQYYHVREPLRFRAMVQNPRFKCEFCGRTASAAHSLCYPAPL